MADVCLLLVDAVMTLFKVRHYVKYFAKNYSFAWHVHSKRKGSFFKEMQLVR